ncbi:thermonuclease family protein [Mycoplana ramosa]|uniref:Thermonuclease family protein n=1 Tax=Mycoplana ramosa TaxID=40837 RepID=A0ABW3Z0Z1_MYCRA
MPPKKPRKRKSNGARRPTSARGRMWPWYLLGLLMVGAIVVRENLPTLAERLNSAAPVRNGAATTVTARTAPAPPRSPVPAPDQKPARQPAVTTENRAGAGEVTFFYCGIKQDNCIVDGGNFIYRGARIRMADIYVPATREAKCDRERLLGGDAKEALRVLLNAGKFELEPWKPIGEDQHGRQLRIVRRDGKSIGDALIERGLARPWSGQRQSWCP